MPAGLYQKCVDIKTSYKDDFFVICFKYEIPSVGYNFVTYRVSVNGEIEVSCYYPGFKNLPSLPAYSFDIKTKKEFCNVKYYGLGPDENYIDRCQGAKLGIYKYNALENLTPYIVPQECGNRCGIRYLELTNKHGQGIKLSAVAEAFQASVLPYSEYELENAMHRDELPKINYTWLRIFGAQMGVGGDDS